MVIIIIIITQFAAYNLYALLGLENSERIVSQITSNAFNKFFFPDDRLLAVHSRVLD